MKDLVVFLGPSLPRSEARALVQATFLPPARQGDLFRVLRSHPRAIALIDGVFEAAPSVWHHELIAAHAAGVRLFGASSMGALRAAELPGCVTPVGVIAQRYVSGSWNDDAFVALLHADESLGFKPLTLPHVNVWATLRRAVAQGVLSAAKGRELERASAAIFYQARSWDAVFSAVRWDTRRLRAFVAAHQVDLKAIDARACLRSLAKAGAARAPRAARFSSFVRRSRLPPRAANRSLEDQGLRTLLLASFAANAGLAPDPRRVAAWARALPREGWADDERLSAAATLALEERVLQAPHHFVSDGPTRAEGLQLAAQRARARSSP